MNNPAVRELGELVQEHHHRGRGEWGLVCDDGFRHYHYLRDCRAWYADLDTPHLLRLTFGNLSLQSGAPPVFGYVWPMIIGIAPTLLVMVRPIGQIIQNPVTSQFNPDNEGTLKLTDCLCIATPFDADQGARQRPDLEIALGGRPQYGD